MINLKTCNEELLSELLLDKKRVLHWYSTKHSSIKKIRQCAYVLERRCIDGDLPYCSGDMVEYVTKSGNKWILYQRAERIGGKVVCGIQCFCYYETCGSVGAFVPISGDYKTGRCVIFTSHFFLRLKQRLGLDVVDKNVLRRFIEYINILHIEMKDGGVHGERGGVVYLNGGVGRGIFRDSECNIFEVRSFLKESEQNGYQMKECENSKRMATNYVNMSRNVVLSRIDMGDSYGVFEDFENNLELMGLNRDRADKEAWVLLTIARVGHHYGKSVDLQVVSDWITDNVCHYPSVLGMFDGDSWECEDSDFSKMVRDGLSVGCSFFIPQIDFTSVFLSEKIIAKMDCIDRMNERRSHYKSKKDV